MVVPTEGEDTFPDRETTTTSELKKRRSAAGNIYLANSAKRWEVIAFIPDSLISLSVMNIFFVLFN